MKKKIFTVCINSILFAVLFCMISCERPEIKPEQADEPTTSSGTLSTDKIVGTWVKCGVSFASNEEPDCMWRAPVIPLHFRKTEIFNISQGITMKENTMLKNSILST